jgi:hypothetical protein
MRKYVPLLFVEIYLLLTVLVFYFGPIQYRIHNPILFFILLLIYHSFFIFGYILSCKLKNFNKTVFRESRYSSSVYWILFLLGIVGIWIAYKNIMLMEGIIPYDFFHNLIRGFTEPGVVYTERMIKMDEEVVTSSRLFNIVAIFFSFAKLLYIFYVLYYWKELSFLKKISALFYFFLFVSTGISAGVNSVIFIFFIFSAISLITILYERRYIHLNKMIFFGGVLFLTPVAWFGKLMSERGGGFDYFAATSTLGDISVSSGFDLTNDLNVIGFLYYSFVWLSYYICQGYYGFSLILSMDLEWTYGFGNSEFLQRQLLMISGVDVSSLTFQSRINHLWDKSAQWHSFYGQFANDVGFIGLAFLMMAIGFFFSRVWLSVLYYRNFYGLALIPILTIMFIFFPANNQIFGYIDTFSYFIFVTLFWTLSLRKTI